MPGRLDDGLTHQLLIWRPILAGKIQMHEVKRGDYSLAELLDLNALLDMQADIDYKAQKDAAR